MSDKTKTAEWEPGTLEKTRKAIGEIAPHEAKVMSKVLGGEVMYERSNNINRSQAKNAGRIVRSSPSSGVMGGGQSSSLSSIQTTPVHNGKSRRNQESLPEIPAKTKMLFDKLMMSDDYKIKPNYGVFNFIKLFQKDGTEQLVTEFCEITIKHQIDNLQAFITVIKTLIQIAPASYKAKIANGTETKFKFLRMVAGWQMSGIKLAHVEMLDLHKPFLTTDLIPFIREIYKVLIQVYYYGDTKIPKLIKDIYADEAAYADAPRDKLSSLAKEAITNWLYIQNEIIRKLYPLLMRMCSDTYEEYPDFFKAKVAAILKFVGLHKFDLLLPEKPKEEIPVQNTQQEEKSKPLVQEKGVYDAITKTGIALLDQLFPLAGFKTLDKFPDMYPYFQPMYRFVDGYNVLSRENPIQVIVTLLRIIEDCLQGLRNIKFSLSDGQKEGDNILKIIEEWTGYREINFEKLYCDPLNTLVNTVYTQSDFEKTQYGKKLITKLLWQTNYYFLPAFKFDQVFLERPANESKLIPLYKRVDTLRNFLTQVVSGCDNAAKTRSAVEFIDNPWEHYQFGIQNEISKRLDTLLGAHNTTATTNANNANLLKYTLCITAVLDWWINNTESPAYNAPPMHIYRVSPEDGKPLFSVPERHDQNNLFADVIRAAYQKQN